MTSPSTIRLLSKHWKEGDQPSQALQEDIGTGNIMEVVERELQKYLKQRYIIIICSQLLQPCPLITVSQCMFCLLDLLVASRG